MTLDKFAHLAVRYKYRLYLNRLVIDHLLKESGLLPKFIDEQREILLDRAAEGCL